MKDSHFCPFQRGKSLTASCVRCSEDKTGHNKRDEGAQGPVLRGSECRRTLIILYVSNPTEEMSGYER